MLLINPLLNKRSKQNQNWTSYGLFSVPKSENSCLIFFPPILCLEQSINRATTEPYHSKETIKILIEWSDTETYKGVPAKYTFILLLSALLFFI